MSVKKSKQKTLSEKINETFVPRLLLDPEKNSDDEITGKFAELNEDDTPDLNDKKLSEFRKRNVKVLSEYNEKYKGKISSRKEIFSDEEENDLDKISGTSYSENEISENDDLEQYRKKLKNSRLETESDESLDSDEEKDDKEISDNSTEDDSDYDSPGDEASELSELSEAEENTQILKETDQNAEIKKGLAVQNQLKIWEKLLEIRIHSQKMLIKANSLPHPQIHEKFDTESQEFSSLSNDLKKNLTNLIENMLEIQQNLMTQFSETKNLLRLKRKRNSSSKDLKNEPAIKKFSLTLQENFENFQNYRNSVLQKWHDRIKILTPGSSKSGQKDFDVVKKIEAVLLNKSDLIKKSQTVKGNYKLFHQKTSNEEPLGDRDESGIEESRKEESSVEIYDDTDFYHQQLRELIEFKANSSNTPSEVTKQFTELQKLRQKMKKKVDTRASKGRKIRYVVHNKLVNFMAPHDNSEWTEESKNELYRSLFAT